MQFNSTMSSVLPFDIIAEIIDNVEDTNLLKELALVSHSFLHICSKHLFATVELHDAVLDHVASSKKGFVKLLTSRPNVVKYIRKLTYSVRSNSPDNDDHLLSPILPNFLRSISNLNCLKIYASVDWNTLNSSLTSAFLHLMHLPTINHLDLKFIKNFPLSSLTSSVNLRQLDIFYLEEDDSPDIVVQTEMPKIREFHTLDSTLSITKLLHAKWQDGRPAFNFMDLRQLSISLEDVQNIRYLLQNAKLLEKLHLSAEEDWSLVGLHDILSYGARTLKVLDLTVHASLPLGVLCEELEAMAGHNALEALSLEINVEGYVSQVYIGSIFQKVEKVLVEPGWSALRQVSFEVPIECCLPTSVDMSEALQSLPDKYLSHLPKLDSVTFNYSAFVVKCAFPC